MLRWLRNEEGMALYTTLILAILCLVTALAVMYVSMTAHRVSGAVLRYTSALEAAKGASEEVLHDIERVLQNNTLTGAWRPGTKQKLTNEYSTADVPSTPADVISSYDWKKTYGDYDAYATLVFTHKDKVPNPLDPSDTLDVYFYGFQIVAVNKNNPEAEKAWLTVVYRLKQKEQ